MFKGLGNLASIVKQAHQMQGKMSDIQERLAELTVEGEAGGGMVKVSATGQQKVVGVRIDPTLLQSADSEMIEDLVVAATNQALDRAREAAAQEMSQLAGGLNIPGLDGALNGLTGGTPPAGSGS